jgi:dienelactone hydrolase
MKTMLSLLLALLANSIPPAHETPLEPELVSFPSGEQTLHGFLYRPAGTGPFPAVLWNHGSEKLPGQQPDLARFYTSHGYVFFIPHRHGHGRSPGEYIGDLQAQIHARVTDVQQANREIVQLQDRYNEDVVAAVTWLKERPEVDRNRIAMSGVSYGGIQTLLAAEKGLGVRAFVPFAPGAMSWANTALRERLLQAVRHARSPLFLIQARNDYSVGPSELLGPEIEGKGNPYRAKIYPPFGTTPQEGHGGFACKSEGIALWGPDVLEFLRATLADTSAR